MEMWKREAGKLRKYLFCGGGRLREVVGLGHSHFQLLLRFLPSQAAAALHNARPRQKQPYGGLHCHVGERNGKGKEELLDFCHLPQLSFSSHRG